MKKTYDSYYSTKEEQLSLTPTQLRNLEAQRVEERRDKIAEKSEKNRQRYGNYLGD